MRTWSRKVYTSKSQRNDASEPWSYDVVVTLTITFSCHHIGQDRVSSGNLCSWCLRHDEGKDYRKYRCFSIPCVKATTLLTSIFSTVQMLSSHDLPITCIQVSSTILLHTLFGIEFNLLSSVQRIESSQRFLFSVHLIQFGVSV